MCELCRLPVCPTQTRTDIIRIIQEELQQAPRSPLAYLRDEVAFCVHSADGETQAQ